MVKQHLKKIVAIAFAIQHALDPFPAGENAKRCCRQRHLPAEALYFELESGNLLRAKRELESIESQDLYDHVQHCHH